MIGKSPAEIAHNLSSDFRSTIEYSVALDALGFTGVGFAKMVDRAWAPQQTLATNTEEQQAELEGRHIQDNTSVF
jgi:hypothetical protein